MTTDRDSYPRAEEEADTSLGRDQSRTFFSSLSWMIWLSFITITLPHLPRVRSEDTLSPVTQPTLS